jgi:hypothetical protein
MSPIYMVAGDKGDGKSLFSMALLDYLTNHGEDCLLIDSDILNPDVHTIYSKEVPSVILDLNNRSGWIELATICESNYGKSIVINGAASGIEGIEKHGKLLLDWLFALSRHLVTFWIVSDDTSGVDSLVRYKKVVGRRIIHIVNNEKYDINHFKITSYGRQRDGFTHTGRIACMWNLSEDTHEYFVEQKVTIKEYINELEANHSSSSELHEMKQWQNDFREYIFKYLNYKIEDLIGVSSKTSYKTFTRRLADEIEKNLKRDRFDDFDYYDSYDSGDRQVDPWDSEDIGDLLAEGKVSIEDLAAAAAAGEDLKEDDRLRLERALEPETEEEYQERLQREYRRGGNPASDFIPSKWDIRYRAYKEYIDGANPKNFIPTAKETRERALNEYLKGRPPEGFIPTEDELDGTYKIPF